MTLRVIGYSSGGIWNRLLIASTRFFGQLCLVVHVQYDILYCGNLTRMEKLLTFGIRSFFPTFFSTISSLHAHAAK